MVAPTVQIMRLIFPTAIRTAFVRAGLVFIALGITDLGAKPAWKADVETVRAAAIKGDSYYQGLLGIKLKYGDSGLKVDLIESEEWSAKAAKKNGAFGLCNLASLEMRKRNFEKGRFLFDEAHLHSNLLRLARAEDAVAIFCLGLIEMESTPRNIVKAVRHFEKASSKGFVPAQAILGMLKHNGIGIPQDRTEGIKWSRAAAQAGSPHGKFQLGMAYSIGEGVEFDQSKSMQLIMAAAEQGLGSAQLTLGMKFANGEGVEHDYAEAIKWLQKASKQGIGEATFQLRRCQTMLKHQPSIVITPTQPRETVAQTPPTNPVVTNPPKPAPVEPATPPVIDEDMKLRLQQARHLLLVERKISQAKSILKQLSAEGVTEAQRLLGIAHYRSEDYRDAHNVFVQAAQKSDPPSQRYLGMIYFLGQGVERDYAKANEWLGKASIQGDQEAIRYQEILQKFYKE